LAWLSAQKGQRKSGKAGKRKGRGKQKFSGTHKHHQHHGMFQQFTQNLKLIRKLFGQSKLQFAVFAGRQVEGKYICDGPLL